MTTNQRATVSEREKEGGRIVDQTNRSGRHHIARILSSSLGGGAAAAVHEKRDWPVMMDGLGLEQRACSAHRCEICFLSYQRRERRERARASATERMAESTRNIDVSEQWRIQD